jgi:hypothetical protein
MLLRDAVTGAPLDFGAEAMRKTVILRLPADLDERSIPPKIDRAEDYHTDEAGVTARKAYNGGLEWSGGFKRYIGGVVPFNISEARRLWWEWWNLPYVLERVRLEVGQEQLDVALALLRDDLPENVVAKRYNHTLYWVVRAKRRAERAVRTKYLPRHLLRHFGELLLATQ